MPIDRVDQLPLPSVRWYAVLSVMGLVYALVYSSTAPAGFLATLQSDLWGISALLNMMCCCFFVMVNLIYSFVFGPLRPVEQQHMRDKFWNFVFYKFIFVFGVMNIQEVREMLGWFVWFSVLGTFILTEQLCKDRFQFLSYSPNTPASSHAKIISLLLCVILSCAGLFMVCAVVGWQNGFHFFFFLSAEAFVLFARTIHTLIRYFVYLWDMHHDGMWENRNMFSYYPELVLELSALTVDSLHHVHMLLWANMFLSVASLILLMKLRFFYQEIQQRIRRHRNYIFVSSSLERSFPQVPREDLMMSDETCAICWEKLSSARRLPCGHIFHSGCLHSWLEHDTVCPTCRKPLQQNLLPQGQGQGAESGHAHNNNNNNQATTAVATANATGGPATVVQRERRRMYHNWLLHFNGVSIASWLPSFSVELHEDGHRTDSTNAANWNGSDAAALHQTAEQVHSMFPAIPLQAITIDLAETHSVTLTVDRILNGTIYIPNQQRRSSIQLTLSSPSAPPIQQEQENRTQPQTSPPPPPPPQDTTHHPQPSPPSPSPSPSLSSTSSSPSSPPPDDVPQVPPLTSDSLDTTEPCPSSSLSQDTTATTTNASALSDTLIRRRRRQTTGTTCSSLKDSSTAADEETTSGACETQQPHNQPVTVCEKSDDHKEMHILQAELSGNGCNGMEPRLSLHPVPDPDPSSISPGMDCQATGLAPISSSSSCSEQTLAAPAAVSRKEVRLGGVSDKLVAHLSPSLSPSPSPSPSPSSSPHSFAALQQRKKQLLQNARMLYIQKHHLKDPEC